MSETLMSDTSTQNGETQEASTAAEQSTSDQQSQTTDQQAADTTAESTTAEETANEGAPESYEFKAPEGQEFDSEFLNAFSESAKELNLTQEKAQAMLDKVAPVMQARAEARIEAVRNEWAETSKADKEFGGEKLKENLSVAKQALDKYATPEFKALLDETGIGNHPEVIRFIYRIGKNIVPDNKFIKGETGHKTGPRTFADQAKTLYS